MVADLGVEEGTLDRRHRERHAYLRPKLPKFKELIGFRNNRNRISSFGQEFKSIRAEWTVGNQ